LKGRKKMFQIECWAEFKTTEDGKSIKFHKQTSDSFPKRVSELWTNPGIPLPPDYEVIIVSMAMLDSALPEGLMIYRAEIEFRKSKIQVFITGKSDFSKARFDELVEFFYRQGWKKGG